jgi:glycine/D-amino acid oxidase-like deaminating enzyme
MARRAVAWVVRRAREEGLEVTRDAALPVSGEGQRLGSLRTASGAAFAADLFVFAGGSWMPRLLPEVLGDRIFPTRQEVFFFGAPLTDRRFSTPALPAWIDFGTAQAYGLPDLDGRGIKVGLDAHGPPFDPDRDDRTPSPEGARAARAILADRFPALAGAPLLESRVCPYENTSNGDFLIDRHPTRGDVWMVGGGSGHGFKHGPAVGEHAVRLVLEGGAPEARFGLASKATTKARSVF